MSFGDFLTLYFLSIGIGLLLLPRPLFRRIMRLAFPFLPSKLR